LRRSICVHCNGTSDAPLQSWFKFEERAIKRMDEVVSRLKQAIQNARVQLWTMRLVRSFLASVHAETEVLAYDVTDNGPLLSGVRQWSFGDALALGSDRPA
jgi:hypothetical protein